MKISKTFFNGSIKLIELNKYSDNRGFFYESYNRLKIDDLNLNTNFVQDNLSYSKKKGVIRGLHFQIPPMSQIKLISVLRGKVLDVFVDLRRNSITYGKHEKIVLSENDNFNLYIPDGFAHGFSVLENKTLVLYKTSNYYSLKHEKTIIYNDEYLNIDWKINISKTISNKDENGMKFKELNTPFKI